MNKLDKQYTDLLQDILDNGVTKSDRTGTGTLSVFGRQIRHKMSEGFPLLTTKKMHWKSIVTELLWFLAGRTDLKWLLEHDNTIWVGDAYQVYCNAYPDAEKTFQYEESTIETRRMTKDEFINMIKTDDEFAKKWGSLGKIYGHQWRSWTNYTGDEINEGTHEMTNEPIDQIANLIRDLKTNPDSRRLMVSAWNVGELDQMVLPPCHNFWQMYSVEKEGKRYLSIMVNLRSNDVPLGLPFNIASYGLLLEIIAKLVDMIPDELVINIGDAHIYLNQIDGIKEQLTREPFELSKLNINTEWWSTESGECGVGPIDAQAVLRSFSDDNFCKCLIEEDLQLYNYQSHPSIKLPLSN